MGYNHILPKDVFIYKALPKEMSHRVVQLPALPELDTEPTLTGFPLIDAQRRKETLAGIDYASLPERKLSGCIFIDELAALVHQYGFKRMEFYAEKIVEQLSPFIEGKSAKIVAISAIELSNAIKVLSSMIGREWVVSYTLMMIKDLQRRTNLKHNEIGKVLQFPTRQSFSQFKRIYSK